MPYRRVSKYLEIEGPLFDDAMREHVQNALAGAIKDLAVRGAEEAQSAVRAGGFVSSGRFVGGIGVEIVRRRGAGYAKVGIVDASAAYPTSDRPTRTWMEYGQRNGRNGRVTRKGVYAFRKSANKLNRMKYDEYFLPALMAALE